MRKTNLTAPNFRAPRTSARDTDDTEAIASAALECITWHGQAAVSLRLAGKIISIDPYKMRPDAPMADIILVTHRHDDHYSPTDILAISKADTVKLATFDAPGFQRIELGDTIQLGGILVKTVPAYNLKRPRFHPKTEGWAGFIVEVDGITFYHTGDTERIPEMKTIRADAMFVPLGQTYTMNSVEEAADAVRDVGPALAIPIHFGMYEGTRADAELFKTLLRGVARVEILTPA